MTRVTFALRLYCVNYTVFKKYQNSKILMISQSYSPRREKSVKNVMRNIFCFLLTIEFKV